LTTKAPEKKGSAQQELTRFDENLDQHFEEIEEDIFNRKERLQQLEDGIISETNTILSAVFQEIKKQSDETRKKATKKNKVHFFNAKARLTAFIRGILQVGKVKSFMDKIRLTRLFSSRTLANSVPAQRLADTYPKDYITYLHANSIRFLVA